MEMALTMLDIKKFIEKQIKYLDDVKICVAKYCHYDSEDKVSCLDVDVEIWTDGYFLDSINAYSTGWVDKKFTRNDFALIENEFIATEKYVKKHFSY